MINKDNFLEIEYFEIPEIVKNWYSEDTLKNRINLQIEENIRNITNKNFSDIYSQMYPINGTIPSDFNNKIIEIDNTKHLITSIRFLGMDINIPFVEVLHKNFIIEDYYQYLNISKIIYQEYNMFNPVFIRFFSNKNIEFEDKIVCDTHYFALPKSEIVKKPLPNKYKEVKLEIARTLVFYDEYLKLIEELYSINPFYRIMVSIVSEQEFIELIKKKMVFNIYINDVWSGIISVNTGIDYYLEGFYFVEEIISKTYRGKGYGAAIQRKLIEQEIIPENEVIFGTINSKNLPSSKTALKVGRKEVGGFYFVNVNNLENL